MPRRYAPEGHQRDTGRTAKLGQQLRDQSFAIVCAGLDFDFGGEGCVCVMLDAAQSNGGSVMGTLQYLAAALGGPGRRVCAGTARYMYIFAAQDPTNTQGVSGRIKAKIIETRAANDVAASLYLSPCIEYDAILWPRG